MCANAGNVSFTSAPPALYPCVSIPRTPRPRTPRPRVHRSPAAPSPDASPHALRPRRHRPQPSSGLHARRSHPAHMNRHIRTRRTAPPLPSTHAEPGGSPLAKQLQAYTRRRFIMPNGPCLTTCASGVSLRRPLATRALTTRAPMTRAPTQDSDVDDTPHPAAGARRAGGGQRARSTRPSLRSTGMRASCLTKIPLLRYSDAHSPGGDLENRDRPEAEHTTTRRASVHGPGKNSSPRHQTARWRTWRTRAVHTAHAPATCPQDAHSTSPGVVLE